MQSQSNIADFDAGLYEKYDFYAIACGGKLNQVELDRHAAIASARQDAGVSANVLNKPERLR